MNWIELLQESWAMRALIASLLVGLMCGILGCFIVLRNMSLIGDALAHAILPGVVFAFLWVGAYNVVAFFTGSVIAGLVAAVSITWIQHNAKTKNDAAIGIVFTAMFSIGVMGISWISRNEGVHLDLKDFLFGNVLGVSDQDLYLTAGVTIYVLLSVIVFYRYLFITTFQPIVAQTMGISVRLVHYFLMLLLAFAVVASLQTVGVILVVAMLITPASTALLLSDKLRKVLLLAAIIGMVSAFLGLLLSIQFETTPGPAMAVTATFFYLLAVFAAPQRGLLFKWYRKYQLRRRIQLEDILKRLFRQQEQANEPLEASVFAQEMGIHPLQLRRSLRAMRQVGWLTPTQHLTEAGRTQALRLVRAHRLWETYLADKIGLHHEQVHDEAEHYEHLLSEELLDEVDKTLGFPDLDPHGEPIPSKPVHPDFPLIRLEVAQHARIAARQMSERITAKLWQLGLLPEMDIILQQKQEDAVEIQTEDHKLVRVPAELARQINIHQ
ncbi:MAG TPA: iron chelate uptake ABC transporter family permease subunit [Saprospiraceae bacterium]|nr:iron chelate uptake ABC transporter family permease subunit [Saprospiraceae bacterium]